VKLTSGLAAASSAICSCFANTAIFRLCALPSVTARRSGLSIF
jgi:hypothetical protein